MALITAASAGVVPPSPPERTPRRGPRRYRRLIGAHKASYCKIREDFRRLAVALRGSHQAGWVPQRFGHSRLW